MAKKMLIDAAHPEETRVVVVLGNRIEEFDFEAAAKKPLKGNIYLAKVTRVEPSLQAAFVDYGGNRHGFLAFSEIHPDYYQIPVADRKVLVAEQEAADRRAAERDMAFDAGDDDDDETAEADNNGLPATENGDAIADEIRQSLAALSNADALSTQTLDDDPQTDDSTVLADEFLDHAVTEDTVPETVEVAPTRDDDGDAPDFDTGIGRQRLEVIDADEEPPVETRSKDDVDEDIADARKRPRTATNRPYKIQEVIKRRQILLVQVVKEERGNKGAALTTYLSLAGRYCVLMPNTARGGGISRKITSQTDRKRLKSAAHDLQIPAGMGLIIRTAGANRTKAEIKRDFEYLLRVWENVRDLTLKSSAPALVYEEGSLIKRAIRDLYGKDIDNILVDGDEGYKEAKAFMRTLMPSHAKVVQPYKGPIPLFQRHQVEAHLDLMFSPTVELRSGGYIVINQTEALVAIDVNSGRATRERSIEETALRTNLEAADEVARQLRLRDLAGLVVIDFIDMEDNRNNRAVEKRLKERLKSDRARIQVGRISAFGLLEMSRQRMRTGVLEGSTVKCPNCEGTGIVRSVESAALRALRSLEEEGLKNPAIDVTIRVPSDTALYILNQKRRELVEIEQRYGLSCEIKGDPTVSPSALILERGAARPALLRGAEADVVRLETAYEADAEAVDRIEVTEAHDEAHDAHEADESGEIRAAVGEDDANRKKRRRRRRRPQRDERGASADAGLAQPPDEDTGEEAAPPSPDAAAGDGEDGQARRRRRGRRGGRRNRRRDADTAETAASAGPDFSSEDAVPVVADPLAGDAPSTFDEDEEVGAMPVTEAFAQSDLSVTAQADAFAAATEPVAERDEIAFAPPEVDTLPDEAVDALAANGGDEDHRKTEPAFGSGDHDLSAALDDDTAITAADDEPEDAAAVADEPAGSPANSEPHEPPRRGWWQRRLSNL